MVLDWEENEALRVLLQKRLVCLFGLDRWSYHNGLLLDFLDGLLDHDVNNRRVGVEGHVLLAGSCELELLGRRLAHLETLNGRGSLQQVGVSN